MCLAALAKSSRTTSGYRTSFLFHQEDGCKTYKTARMIMRTIIRSKDFVLNKMLHVYLGNPYPWHGHYYTVLALILSFILQILLFKMSHDDRTAGVSLCTIAVFSYLVKTHYAPGVFCNVMCLFCWGIRICVRGVPTPRYTFVLPSACTAAVGKAAWAWILAAPTSFAVAMDTNELFVVFPFIGLIVCSFAMIVDCLEKDDIQGTSTRNPYIFCSACMSWGLYVMHPVATTLIFPVIFTSILFYGSGGYISSESSRLNRALKDPETMEYMRQTSPFFPMFPGMYPFIPRVIKKLCCCEAFSSVL